MQELTNIHNLIKSANTDYLNYCHNTFKTIEYNKDFKKLLEHFLIYTLFLNYSQDKRNIYYYNEYELSNELFEIYKFIPKDKYLKIINKNIKLIIKNKLLPICYFNKAYVHDEELENMINHVIANNRDVKYQKIKKYFETFGFNKLNEIFKNYDFLLNIYK